LAATFRSLRHRNYRLYFFGQLVSLLGSWLQTTALMWLAFERTGQSRWPALISAAQMLPTFLFGAVGGALADRWSKRTVLLGTQGGLLVLALVLASLIFGGAGTPWQLLAVTAASGLIQAVDLPARLAFVVEMVGREDLVNAVGLNAMLFNVARLLGPALGGLLLLWPGPAWCFLLNGLSYGAVLWALGRMDIAGSARTADAGQGMRGLFAGFTYLAGKPRLAFLVLSAGWVALCGWPFLSLLPAVARHTLGWESGGYSLMLSATGSGALTAALTVATFASADHRRWLIATGAAVLAAALLGLSAAGTLPVAAGCCILAGFGLILFLATSQGVVQLAADDLHRGRVMGIWAMALSGAVPLGNLLAGFAADRWGEALVLRGAGVACTAAALTLLGLLWLSASRRPEAGR
jgi:MFS family permease